MRINRVCCQIDLAQLGRNIRTLRDTFPEGTKICAVIKANAYGHGDIRVAQYLEGRADFIAVATASEAMGIRDFGIRTPILILGQVFPEDYVRLIEEDVRMTVFRRQDAEAISEAAVRTGKKARIHIKIDTGMNRLGFSPGEETVQTITEICRMDGIRAEGIFTHFARADEEDRSWTVGQFEQFSEIVKKLEGNGITFSLRHCANSAAALNYPEYAMNMVRLGLIMYGWYPSDNLRRAEGIAPALTLLSTVIMVKTVEAGQGISYNHIRVLDRPARVATIPIGYGDGYPRLLSDRGFVLIRGQRAPILGRICMDQMMVDVTGIPGVTEGDVVTLVGRDGEEAITLEEISDRSGVFPYEFLTQISPRVPRIYNE